MGEKYGLSSPGTEALKDSSLLHDIGTFAIPDSILQKPGPLTDAELGHYILKHSDRRLLRSAAIIARQHHGRWDGKGYLRGRITTQADEFDAIASDRIYEKAWDIPRAVDLFTAEWEHQFYTDLVMIFHDNLEALVKILND